MQFKDKTKFGEKNLIWAIENYALKYDASENAEKIRNAIFPCVDPDIKIENYTDTNIALLKKLFDRIKTKNLISNDDFRSDIQPVITNAIDCYYKDTYEEDHPLWGAWFLAEGRENVDPFGAFISRTLSEEVLSLQDLLLSPENPYPKALGFALCVFAGLSVSEVMNAKWRDISLLPGNTSSYGIHTMGAFPLRREPTEFETRPRQVPLIDSLYDALMRRKEEIEKSVSFPLETSFGMAKSIEDLPLISEKEDPGSHYSIGALSRYATSILRIGLEIDELRLSYTCKDMLAEPHLYAFERSSAYYMGRRTFATIIYSAGISEALCMHLMGHSWPEDYGEKPEIRSEDILDAKEKLEKNIAETII